MVMSVGLALYKGMDVVWWRRTQHDLDILGIGLIPWKRD
jgi:hypothetical protein